MSGPVLRIMRLPHALSLPAPSYQTDGAAGLDLMAAIAENEKITLENGERGLVPTGLKIQLPDSHEAQIRPRSGLALRHGVTVLNAPGTLDADYRGEVMALLINLGAAPFVIRRGDRIAQLVIAPVTRVTVSEVDALDETRRGAGGFGSTG